MALGNTAPEIVTERLRLRSFRAGDFEEYVELVGHPLVARHVGDGTPLDRTAAWRHLAMVLGHWILRGCGMWAVEHDGRMIGRVGLLNPDGWPALELAWALHPGVWNRGLATEAAAAAMDWAFDAYGANRLISMVRPDNAASIRVAEKLGMEQEERLVLLGLPALVYARGRDIRQASP